MNLPLKTSRCVLFTAIALSSFPLFSAELPPAPPSIIAKGVLKAGVRCDQPPYGFIDATRSPAGVEVDMARQIAQWVFGDAAKLDLTCVTAENRVSQLAAGRVDLLIATLGITPERERVIDFSKPYRWGESGVLVKQGSPLKKVADLAGHTVATPKGSVQAQWFEENMPTVTTLRLNSSSDSLQALKQGRADAYAHDGATLKMLTTKDTSVYMLDDAYQYSNTGIGLRKNEPQWKAFIDASIDKMRSDDLFRQWINQSVPQEITGYYINMFQNPRPDGK
ncbi:transporter substrate-binding domain-containing protein [Brenneria goodwinii]|uniref:transporter substrate-binding domain-containing protein n=1 Tax=Brenneria goodwinii TaxID=1109412 RepID=UPI000EF1B77A|nr:transporter substrate-binding domain-containing protein [Brenneria goodwinii]MCG8158804.1 transporter substrate-binding domain-containing protein [Brenneria goodwinii]MCG8163393.1 transporter substrate-binding domain-containing protein [Brenneria goodwinii]MCG8167933.1 transporter substrate-binding domain-containing protein [Brenneria goodwinii]MCG8172544.1 transporter substrate-binding domain-containing protein [Brenneria goodwinii]MCG8177262.1 transporter substrate-binding domain-containi